MNDHPVFRLYDLDDVQGPQLLHTAKTHAGALNGITDHTQLMPSDFDPDAVGWKDVLERLDHFDHVLFDHGFAVLPGVDKDREGEPQPEPGSDDWHGSMSEGVPEEEEE